MGRGLSALLGDQNSITKLEADTGGMVSVAITDLRPCPFQPRRRFADLQLNELAKSLLEKGILQPLVIRSVTGMEGYEIICGERRWRAAQLAQIHSVPAVLRHFTDREALEIALVENLQRENLAPLEEAEAYQRLKVEFGHTQEELAEGVGKSRSHVANMLRLLLLPDGVKTLLANGELSVGHARAVLAAPNSELLAQQAVEKGLSVREIEALAQKEKPLPQKPTMKKLILKDADTLDLERDLTSRLGLTVEISPKVKGGHLLIQYKSLDQLDLVIQKLSGK